MSSCKEATTDKQDNEDTSRGRKFTIVSSRPVSALKLDMNHFGAKSEEKTITLSPKMISYQDSDTLLHEHSINTQYNERSRTISEVKTGMLHVRKGRHAPITPRTHPFTFIDEHFSTPTQSLPLSTSLNNNVNTRIISIENGLVQKVQVDDKNKLPHSPILKNGEYEYEFDSDQEDEEGSITPVSPTGYESPTSEVTKKRKRRRAATTVLSPSNPMLVLEVKISNYGWRSATVKSKPFVVYDIEIFAKYGSSKVKWTVMRRYNEFRALHSILKRKYESLKKKKENNINYSLPSLPTRLLLNNKAEESIRQRMVDLQSYLITIVDMVFTYENDRRRNNGYITDSYVSDSYYDALLTFLDVQASPLSYLFSFQVQLDDGRILQQKRSWYDDIRSDKKSMKALIEQENQKLALAELNILDQSNDQQRMYEERFAAAEKLRNEMEKLRLLGDEFLVDIKGQIYIMNISPDHFIYIYPYHDHHNHHNDDEVIIHEPYTSRERCAYERSSSIKKYIIHADRVKSIKPLPNTYKGDGLEAMVLIYKSEDMSSQERDHQLIFYALDRQEMIETIGAHIRFSNLNHIRMRTYIRDKMLPLRDERYDSNNNNHEQLLLQLWKETFPNEELSARKSEQWVKLGFQGQDPATDFRSMGMLGLNHLIYVVRNKASMVRYILSKDRQYPFAVALINASHTLLSGEMQISARITQKSLKESMDDSIWQTSAFLFLCSQAHCVEYPFEELLCMICELLDVIWERDQGTYMRFGEILKTTMDLIRQALLKKPTSFQHLRYLLDI
jgi:hypothetical protein